ncbi:MAG: amidohydrolase family protein [Coriobacteriia bacterium]|nr:amidohydrolase family protein [Coriobacteriia bacterium]
MHDDAPHTPVIDFHTHAFPDELAPRALKTLCTNVDNLYEPVHDGTVSGLLVNMDRWGIDRSVLLPVVTKESQTRNTNEWAASCRSDRIAAFGSIYPHSSHYQDDIDHAVELGLPGLKFHAEYQDFIVDDPWMLRVYDYAFSKGLILIHHGGFDPGFEEPYKSSPMRFANVVDAMRGGTLVVAHLGGHAQWDDVERYLVGTDVYLDTSMGLEYYDHAQFLRIVDDHGAERILFGSDAPWSSAGAEIEIMRSLPLSDSALASILGGNAARLLGIQPI